MSFIDRLRSNEPTFAELDYDDSLALAGSDEQDFEAALRANTTLQVFRLTASRRSRAWGQSLIRERLVTSVCQCRNLRKLLIYPRNQYDSRLNLSALCQAVKTCPTLETLLIRNAQLYNWENCQALQNHPSLKCISLTKITFGDRSGQDVITIRLEGVGLVCFIEKLSTLALLENFELELKWRIENYLQREESWVLLARSNLRVLKLNRSFITSSFRTYGEGFIDSLEQNTDSKLEVLNLANNSISSDRCERICRAITTKPSLKVLDLKRTQQSIHRDFRLQGMSFWLRQNGTLETLNLSNNYVHDEGARMIASVLSDSRSGLKKLHLDHAHIDNEGLLLIAQALEERNKKLIFLSIRHNQLTESAALAFVKALTKNQTLKYLDLYIPLTAPLSRSCGEAFVSMMKENTVLTNLIVPLTKQTQSRQIRMFVSLNRKGRGWLLDHPSSKNEWLKCLSFFGHNIDVVSYLIRTNPTLCSVEN